jgi:hypothetical protein
MHTERIPSPDHTDTETDIEIEHHPMVTTKDSQMLRYIILILNIMLLCYILLYFIVDLTVVIYYGASGWANSYVEHSLVGHFSISFIHMILACVPYIAVCIVGFFSLRPKYHEKTIVVLNIVYIAGLFVCLILHVLINLADVGVGQIGTGNGYGWSNAYLLSVALVSSSIIRTKRLRAGQM